MKPVRPLDLRRLKVFPLEKRRSLTRVEEVVVSPDAPPPQLAAPAGAFELEQAVSLRRGSATGFAVLTKLVEQGPGFDLYEFVPVS
jgi:hypothetical protein